MENVEHLRMWVGRKEFADIFYFLALHCVVFPAFLSMIGFSSLWFLLLTSFLIGRRQTERSCLILCHDGKTLWRQKSLRYIEL